MIDFDVRLGGGIGGLRGGRWVGTGEPVGSEAASTKPERANEEDGMACEAFDLLRAPIRSSHKLWKNKRYAQRLG